MRDPLLTIEEVSERTRVPVNSLRFMRQNGTGPRSGKLGKRIFYREQDVEAWIAAAFTGDARAAS